MNDQKENGPTAMETLLGGLDLSVKKSDGTFEAVKVRQLPVRALPAYLLCLEDEPVMVELFCDKPKGWADTLAPESFTEIVEKGEAINADFFDSWYQRKVKRLERLVPGARERLMTEALRSQSTSPNSPLPSVSGSPTPANTPSRS